MQVETGLLLRRSYFYLLKHIIFIFLTLSLRVACVQFEFVCLFACLFVLHHPESIVEGSSCLFPSQHWSCLIYACATVSGNHSVLFRQSRRWLHKPAAPRTARHGTARQDEAKRGDALACLLSAKKRVSGDVCFSQLLCFVRGLFSHICIVACVCVCVRVRGVVWVRVLQRCKHTNSASG